MPDALSANQQRTAAARAAFAAKFESPEAKTEFYRALGQKSAEGRLVLSADQAEALAAHAQALADAYQFLSRIAGRKVA